MSKHTQGPWRFRPHRMQCFDNIGVKRDGFNIDGPESLGDMECGAFNEADARLIAAAPDLLEALKPFLEDDIYDGDHTRELVKAVKIARAAIAKAEGPQ